MYNLFIPECNNPTFILVEINVVMDFQRQSKYQEWQDMTYSYSFRLIFVIIYRRLAWIYTITTPQSSYEFW